MRGAQARLVREPDGTREPSRRKAIPPPTAAPVINTSRSNTASTQPRWPRLQSSFHAPVDRRRRAARTPERGAPQAPTAPRGPGSRARPRRPAGSQERRPRSCQRPRRWGYGHGDRAHASACDDARIDELGQLATAAKVVAVGESGLDFHYMRSPREAQEASLRRHLKLAAALNERRQSNYLEDRNAQNISFKLSWMLRGSLRVPRTSPNG